MTSSIPDQLGPFQVLGLLGSGGMGEVFLGRRRGPGGFSRAVVLKRLLPHLARQPSTRAMFLDEARILAGIRHRNVVQVQELGEDGDQLFIAMEYLEGETLARLVREQISKAAPQVYRDCAYIMAEVASGLAAAHSLRDPSGHQLNVVHRDVSLSNIFVTYDGEVKLIDFGIAKSDNRLHQTEPGLMRGTSAYMSPEQVTGRSLDARSDIFSFGVVLFELTTRRRLFKRASVHETHKAILRGIANSPRDSYPDYPLALDEVCMKCLAVRPEDRYQSAETLYRDLKCAIDLLPGLGSPDEALSRQMQTFFADRIASRSKMLQQLKEGGPVSAVVPATDNGADDDSDLKSPVVGMSSFVEGYTSPKRRMAVAGIAMLLAGLAGFLVVLGM
ncbi:MAG: serine/threonine-protein kinase [Myxococcota bacterium]